MLLVSGWEIEREDLSTKMDEKTMELFSKYKDEIVWILTAEGKLKDGANRGNHAANEEVTQESAPQEQSEAKLSPSQLAMDDTGAGSSLQADVGEGGEPATLSSMMSLPESWPDDGDIGEQGSSLMTDEEDLSLVDDSTISKTTSTEV